MRILFSIILITAIIVNTLILISAIWQYDFNKGTKMERVTVAYLFLNVIALATSAYLL